MTKTGGDPERLRWERALLPRVRRGDREAIAELYRAYSPSLYRRVLLPKLGAASAAEDALAETWKKALRSIESYEDRGVGLYPWLARIAANKAIDMHRARARSRRALSNLESLLDSEAAAGPRDPYALVSAAEEQERLAERVEQTLDRINPRYRRAIELRFFEDRDRAACAEVLEVKIGTFDVLMLRALRAFRRSWEQRDD